MVRSTDINNNSDENSLFKGVDTKSTLIHDDNGESNNLLKKDFNSYDINSIPTGSEQNLSKSIMHSANIFSNLEIKSKLYTHTFRYGLMSPSDALSSCREYLFFTKPDLHILQINDSTQECTGKLVDFLGTVPFWTDLRSSRVNTIKALQSSFNNSNIEDPFNHLLQNQCISNLDIPSISSELIETPKNIYGVGYSYRGSSEASDDDPDFSLEFKDNKYLDTYMFFKAYEEYETLKHHGVIAPAKRYIEKKILHDAFAIYKFIVADDMETIIYYGKMYGVIPKSLPRDVFSNTAFENGISYSVDFKAAFYEDMKPDIIADFNNLSGPLYNSLKYQINPYNQVLGRADTRPAIAAAVIKDTTSAAAKESPTGFIYKLKWRGDDTI